MIKQTLNALVFVGLFYSMVGVAAGREIILTIDDLPFVGANNSNARTAKRSNERIQSIIQALVDHKVHATGFVIGEAMAKPQLPMLQAFRDQGFYLGNHTYSHKSLDSLSAERYIADIDRADKLLTPFITEPKYFRYPYLAESHGAKKQKIYAYLKEHHYTIVPVTIDSKDYRFNAELISTPWHRRAEALKRIKARYLAYIWNQTVRAEAIQSRQGHQEPQILLVHANLLNSHLLGDVIEMYQKHGYVFVRPYTEEPAPSKVEPIYGSLPNLNYGAMLNYNVIPNAVRDLLKLVQS